MTLFPTKNAAEDAAGLAVDSGKCLGGRRAHHIYAVRETQIFLHKNNRAVIECSDFRWIFGNFSIKPWIFHGDFHGKGQKLLP